MNEPPAKSTVARHKTAIKRQSFSLPVKCLLRDGLLDTTRTFFDYGCGHGQDIAMLSDMNFGASGWDPVHRPDGERKPADVVNLGYVINVIEDPQEREQVVRRAWDLCNTALTVAAQVEFAAAAKVHAFHADGILMSRGTFQKYYNQYELRDASSTLYRPGSFARRVFRAAVKWRTGILPAFRRAPLHRGTAIWTGLRIDFDRWR